MSNSILDTHCHPQFPQYDKDREEMIKRALDAGIQMICVGTDLEMSKKAIDLAEKHGGPNSPNGERASIWASVGLHPNDANIEYGISNMELLIQEPKVVAVGEVGLDYYRTTELEKQNLQKKVLKQFVGLALKYKKPLILHCRDSRAGSTGRAYPDMIDILHSTFDIRNSKLGGVVHSYTGSLDEAKQFLNLGMYLGFNGIITFARQYDEIVRYAPLDRILLETDAPYLTPEPYRGQRNEPSYVIEVAKKIAQLRGDKVENIIVATTRNAEELFNPMA